MVLNWHLVVDEVVVLECDSSEPVSKNVFVGSAKRIDNRLIKAVPIEIAPVRSNPWVMLNYAGHKILVFRRTFPFS